MEAQISSFPWKTELSENTNHNQHALSSDWALRKAWELQFSTAPESPYRPLTTVYELRSFIYIPAPRRHLSGQTLK